jgi:iron(II)-dependent oxidoreductase
MAYPKAANTQLIEALRETRTRTLELVDDLSDAQWMGPHLAIVNPLRWEIAHVAWFQEFWILRHFGKQPPILKNGDDLYDSARVAHDTRWDLPLLKREETFAYMETVLERVIRQANSDRHELTDEAGYDQKYFLNLVLLHEQMHDEAITYTRQTLSYPPPAISSCAKHTVNEMESPQKTAQNTQTSGFTVDDANIPGGTFTLGSSPGKVFVFDNELLIHEVEIAPFTISKTAVTSGQFKRFVEDGGYLSSELWTDEGWQWRTSVHAEHPVYWLKEGNDRWLRRNFDQWVTLDERQPVIHVNWYEAEAYCRWSGRRLPTEAEWELAASAEPTAADGSISAHKREFPWGNETPTSERANLDSRAPGCLPVDALAASDSAYGCRQMIGNVWEWTASDFNPYPGFIAGPYKDYSVPWFGDHKVLRGGCWVTRARLIRNTYRNFYQPDRRDVWAGFRTCAL